MSEAIRYFIVKRGMVNGERGKVNDERGKGKALRGGISEE